MNPIAERYYRSIKGKKIYFLGAGVSHRQLITKFAAKGALVTLCDSKQREEFSSYCQELDKAGVQLHLGKDYLSGICEADIIFRSPGIDWTKMEIQDAYKKGIDVTSEIETFFKLCPAHIIGITGSDGKTTTTTLIAEMLKASGKTVYLGGNIGTPLLPMVDDMREGDYAVVELSSFQLISMRQSAEISVVTNLAPNHLDHHASMEEYVNAKRNILLYQKPTDAAVLNYENDITKGFSHDVRGELSWFSARRPVNNGTYIDDAHNLVLVDHKKETIIMNLDGIKLPGAHNRENVAAAVAAVRKLVQVEVIRKVASEFPGVEHRIELVSEKGGVRWYNDSIGTSPTRTIAGLRSFNQRIILLAGGYDKKISYSPLAPEIIDHVKYLLLCGDTAKIIREEIEKRDDFNPAELAIEMTDNITESVKRASEVAREGDVVMLSPASASFDAYTNFEERGRHFKQLVTSLD